MIWFLVLFCIGSASARIYSRCELAKELKYQHRAPEHQLATWICIAERESSYNTSAIGRLNTDSSEDHGLFQISDQYWCSRTGRGKGCNLACAELEDDDITNDFICAQTIFKEHTRLSGDGFTAWAVYVPHCKGQKSAWYTKDCFTDGPSPPSPPSPPAPGTTTLVSNHFHVIPSSVHGFFGQTNTGMIMKISTNNGCGIKFQTLYTRPPPVRPCCLNTRRKTAFKLESSTQTTPSKAPNLNPVGFHLKTSQPRINELPSFSSFPTKTNSLKITNFIPTPKTPIRNDDPKSMNFPGSFSTNTNSLRITNSIPTPKTPIRNDDPKSMNFPGSFSTNTNSLRITNSIPTPKTPIRNDDPKSMNFPDSFSTNTNSLRITNSIPTPKTPIRNDDPKSMNFPDSFSTNTNSLKNANLRSTYVPNSFPTNFNGAINSNARSSCCAEGRSTGYMFATKRSTFTTSRPLYFQKVKQFITPIPNLRSSFASTTSKRVNIHSGSNVDPKKPVFIVNGVKWI